MMGFDTNASPANVPVWMAVDTFRNIYYHGSDMSSSLLQSCIILIQEISAAQVLSTAAFAVVFIYLYIILARIFFHPLSKFPGPWYVTVSRWYEFYCDVILDGQYGKEYTTWHEKYKSPIVRIGPNIVHVNDPEFYHEIFKSGYDYLKPAWFYKNLGAKNSIVTMTDPHQHRLFRGMVNPMFSGKAVEAACPDVSASVVKIAEKLANGLRLGKPVNIHQLCRCFTMDTVCEVLFGNSPHLLESEEEYPEILASFDMFTSNVWLLNHFPILIDIALTMPYGITKKIAPGYVKFRLQCEKWVKDVVKRRSEGKFTAEDGRQTVFDLVLEPNPDKLYKTPRVEELVDHAFVFVAAGTDAAAHSLAIGIYYLLANPKTLFQLRSELDEALPYVTKPDYKRLQSLPYLSAVIKEMLRMSGAVPGILPRVVPPQGVVVQSQLIPGGSTVAISQRMVQDHPEVFHDPTAFRPERWLGKQGKALERWHVAFSKGPRRCLGSSFAYLELYVAVSYLFSRFDMELNETDASTVEWRDHVIAGYNGDVKVKVLRDNWSS